LSGGRPALVAPARGEGDGGRAAKARRDAGMASAPAESAGYRAPTEGRSELLSRSAKPPGYGPVPRPI
jgi:hypothetical protein